MEIREQSRRVSDTYKKLRPEHLKLALFFFQAHTIEILYIMQMIQYLYVVL